MITREIARMQKRKTHNRAYSIQHGYLAEMNSLPFFPQGRTACSAQSTSSLADASRSQPPRGRRLVLLLLFSGSPRSLLEWGSLLPNLCSSLLSLVAETSPIRNGERRLVMLRGPSQPRFEKQNVHPDLCSRCRLQPPFPLPQKLVVASMDCAPRPDVSPPYHRASLRVKFPTAAVGERALDVLEDDSTS